ncbi:MAG: MgtC/SapB family protein [Anaerolineae bacterium]|nr:MgtC/SapB family protein [Anaerolineae bacterium]
MDNLTLIFRVLGAALLGAIVGFEREWEHKPAGLRTIMVITIGAALVMLLAQRAPNYLDVDVDMVTLDPTRILAALIQGVGFLGAGMIITGRRTVQGLTTAAAIWAMAMVGAAAGIGDWALAVTGTLVCFFVLRVLGPLSFNPPQEKDKKLKKDNKNGNSSRAGAGPDTPQ